MARLSPPERLLSSRSTWLYKYALGTLWIAGFAGVTLAMFVAPQAFGEDVSELRPLFAGATLLGAAFFYWHSMRLKRVRQRGDVLLISNFRREIEVPLRDVERVSGSVLVTPELIFLRFRRPTAFGDRIVFMAPWRPVQGLNRHPLVRELRQLAEAP